MNDFRTVIQLAQAKNKIKITDRIFMLGSCFTENIGAKFNYYKIRTELNPFGILYNPESVAQSIDILLNKREFTEFDLIEHEGVWHSFHHHSRFSGIDKDDVLKNINNKIESAYNFLKQTDHIIFTLGTAWVYKHLKTNDTVSNCHKIPSKEFSRERLSVDEIANRLSEVIARIKEVNKKAQIIFTVSPVRHLKDGNCENQLSKSTLIIAINKLMENEKSSHYFPSYEIMMDDLRDYRFYNSDMIHPSDAAIDYIWKKFTETWIDKSLQSNFSVLDKIKRASSHRPFHPHTYPHQIFLKKQLEKIDELKKKYNWMDFSEEVEIFNSQITD